MAKVSTFEYGVFADAPSEWQKPIENQLLPFTLGEIDTLGPNDKPDACVTRRAKWRLHANEQTVENHTSRRRVRRWRRHSRARRSPPTWRSAARRSSSTASSTR
ncbi:hypothetical protein ABIC83_002167 [Roseateles asaccharophilus]|uniref:hypothetical protein n=1 Tax=Roseateles asaccharophilus TaxID=582607 RepID=UPI003834C3F1